MRSKTGGHSANLMFTVLLMIAFALFSLMLAGIGAAVYQNSARQLNENYTSRTAVAYVTEKIRQNLRQDSLFLDEIDGIPALVLRSEGSDTSAEETFLTYIYFWDGALRELFVREGTEVTSAMGSSLVELSDFSFSLEDSLLRITAVSPEGNTIFSYQTITVN